MARLDTDCGEAHLDELLADPMVRLLMRRDGVRRRDVEELIANLDLRGARVRFSASPNLVAPGGGEV